MQWIWWSHHLSRNISGLFWLARKCLYFYKVVFLQIVVLQGYLDASLGTVTNFLVNTVNFPNSFKANLYQGITIINGNIFLNLFECSKCSQSILTCGCCPDTSSSVLQDGDINETCVLVKFKQVEDLDKFLQTDFFLQPYLHEYQHLHDLRRARVCNFILKDVHQWKVGMKNVLVCNFLDKKFYKERVGFGIHLKIELFSQWLILLP